MQKRILAALITLFVVLVLWAGFGRAAWLKHSAEKSALSYFENGECGQVLISFENTCGGPCKFRSDILDTCRALVKVDLPLSSETWWLKERAAMYDSNEHIVALIETRIADVEEAARRESLAKRVQSGSASIGEFTEYLGLIVSDEEFAKVHRPEVTKVLAVYSSRGAPRFAGNIDKLLEVSLVIPEIADAVDDIGLELLRSGRFSIRAAWYNACQGGTRPIWKLYSKTGSDSRILEHTFGTHYILDREATDRMRVDFLAPSLFHTRNGLAGGFNPAVCIKTNIDSSNVARTCTYMPRRKRQLFAVDYEVWLVDISNAKTIDRKSFRSTICPFRTDAGEGEKIFGKVPVREIGAWADSVWAQRDASNQS